MFLVELEYPQMSLELDGLYFCNYGKKGLKV